MLEFDAPPVGFAYPDSWTIADESSGENVQVTAQSPDGAFWTLVLVPDAPSLESIMESVETAYHDDYPEGDIGPRWEDHGSRGRTLGTRAEFVCLDLIAGATAVAFYAGDQGILILTQTADVERETAEPAFEAMTASLRIDGRQLGSEEELSDPSPWSPELFDA